MATDPNRRSAFQGGAAGDEHMSASMFNYIGTPASRVDGRAKVIGAAKYAGKDAFPNLPNFKG